MISAVPVRIIGDLLNAKTKAIPRTEPGMMKGEHRNDVKNAVQCISFPHGKVGDENA